MFSLALASLNPLILRAPTSSCNNHKVNSIKQVESRVRIGREANTKIRKKEGEKTTLVESINQCICNMHISYLKAIWAISMTSLLILRSLILIPSRVFRPYQSLEEKNRMNDLLLLKNGRWLFFCSIS
jgi:hypothetical protein